MKHMAFGKFALLGVFVLAGCYKYASETINNGNYNTIEPTPGFVTVKTGDSSQVIVRLVNDADNGAITDYTVSEIGSGIAVHENLKYRPVFDATKDTLVATGPKTAQQFFVVGLAAGKYTFKLTPTMVNTGVSKVVTVVVAPISLGAASLSKTTGLAAGDTVVITAPPNTVFSQTSAVSFDVGPAPGIIARAADSSSITILVAPGDSGSVTITKVGMPFNVPAGGVTLTSTNAIALVPPILVAPTTVSTTTPAFGASVTVTLGGNLRFLSGATVKFGSTPTFILSRSADSTSVVVVPFGGVTGGVVNYTNIALSFLNSVPFTLNGDKTVTIGPITADPATNTLATAPTIVMPDSGKSIVVTGAGPFNNPSQCAGSTGDGCQLYKVVLTGPTSYDATLIWQGGADMGLYRLNAAGTTASAQGGCDNLGQGASGQPESCSVNGLAAGTYYFAVVFFGTGSGYPPDANTVPPTWYQFMITRR